MKENIRIESPLKSRRTHSREPVGERCWVFTKELREHHEGKAVYGINPYVEMYPVRESIYAIFNKSLDGAGDVWIYLTVGEEKAMVIDTGSGLGDLKGLCGKLSGGGGLIVVNTHPHIDHAYGNCQFKQVYCHEYVVPQLMIMNRPDAWERLFDEQETPIWTELGRKDLIAYCSYRITGVPGGYEFSLGNGHLVELILTIGHASGHCTSPDKRDRLLLTSDDVISMRIRIGRPHPGDVYDACATVVQCRNRMRKLVGRLDGFDYMFPGHFVFDPEHETIESLTRTVEAIVAEPKAHDYAEEADTPRRRVLRIYRFVPRLGTIAYMEKSVDTDCQGKEVSMQILTGRTCIFSGAPGGDEMTVAKVPYAGGMSAAMVAYRLKEAEKLAEEISASDVSGLCMCVTGKGKEVAESRSEVLENINEQFGSIDTVISNIGADSYGIELQEVTRELLMRSTDHPVGGGFEMMKGALPYLKQGHAPRVIFMTTVEGRYGGTHESCISAIAKGGALSMVLDSAARLGWYGTTVSCIPKGAVKREGYIRPDAPKPEELLSRIPMGRIRTSEDLAQAVCYPTSEETGYITGQVLNVCGGLYMGQTERRMEC